MLNLVINARDALPSGGAIRVDVGRETIGAAKAAADSDAAPGEYVRLRVRDNGTGMTADIQEHLFEPFFTTKEVGEGTGLGLAFVHGVARHAGGFVTIDTAPGKGTTVSVYLPPAPPGAVVESTDTAVARALTPPSGATILLVEDEEGVRKLTARMLTQAGYRVVQAGSAAEARTLFARHERGIDLLLTDVVMPETHGTVLAEELTAKRSGLPVLFVSGYSATMPESAAVSGRVAFLGSRSRRRSSSLPWPNCWRRRWDSAW